MAQFTRLCSCEMQPSKVFQDIIKRFRALSIASPFSYTRYYLNVRFYYLMPKLPVLKV